MALPSGCELISVQSSDGLKLHGLWEPGTETGPAVLMVHGTGSNFYGASVLGGLSRRLRQAGWSTLRVNTRGHDLVFTSSTAQGVRRFGAAYELVRECLLDLEAWLQYLQAQGASRIVLLGHSLGAVKGVYLLAHRPQVPVSHLVAVSPARLNYHHFRQSDQGAHFEQLMNHAQQLIRSGNPQGLMEVDFPLPYLVSAQSFVDKYGPENHYDLLALLPQVQVPQLYTFGTEELGHVAFSGLPEAIAQTGGDQVKVQVIAGADHHYQGRLDELAEVILQQLG